MATHRPGVSEGTTPATAANAVPIPGQPEYHHRAGASADASADTATFSTVLQRSETSKAATALASLSMLVPLIRGLQFAPDAPLTMVAARQMRMWRDVSHEPHIQTVGITWKLKADGQGGASYAHVYRLWEARPISVILQRLDPASPGMRQEAVAAIIETAYQNGALTDNPIWIPAASMTLKVRMKVARETEPVTWPEAIMYPRDVLLTMDDDRRFTLNVNVMILGAQLTDLRRAAASIRSRYQTLCLKHPNALIRHLCQENGRPAELRDTLIASKMQRVSPAQQEREREEQALAAAEAAAADAARRRPPVAAANTRRRSRTPPRANSRRRSRHPSSEDEGERRRAYPGRRQEPRP